MNKVAEVFWQFLILGCVSFGGPAAHIGYFQTTFVQKLKWLDESSYARLISLSQFLPGPGSSQIGFAIGLLPEDNSFKPSSLWTESLNIM